MITTITQSLIWTNNVGMTNEDISPVPLKCSIYTHGASIELSPLSDAKTRWRRLFQFTECVTVFWVILTTMQENAQPLSSNLSMVPKITGVSQSKFAWVGRKDTLELWGDQHFFYWKCSRQMAVIMIVAQPQTALHTTGNEDEHLSGLKRGIFTGAQLRLSIHVPLFAVLHSSKMGSGISSQISVFPSHIIFHECQHGQSLSLKQW